MEFTSSSKMDLKNASTFFFLEKVRCLASTFLTSILTAAILEEPLGRSNGARTPLKLVINLCGANAFGF